MDFGVCHDGILLKLADFRTALFFSNKPLYWNRRESFPSQTLSHKNISRQYHRNMLIHV